MLASAAAGLQGRATAEVCDVYGVDTSMLKALSPLADANQAQAAAPFPDAHPSHIGADSHVGHHGHGAHHASTVAAHAHHATGDASTAPVDQAPAHGPGSRVSHGGDHCALSALAFALASDAPVVVARPASVAPLPTRKATSAPAVDPAARWAAQLRHGPPVSS